MNRADVLARVQSELDKCADELSEFWGPTQRLRDRLGVSTGAPPKQLDLRVDEGMSYQDSESLWHILVRINVPSELRGVLEDVLNIVEEQLEVRDSVAAMLVPVPTGSERSDRETTPG